MSHVALFVLGAPGVGKTSLVRALLGMPERAPGLIQKPKWTVTRIPEVGFFQICAVGHYTGATFDGGDTVAYNGAKASLEYWERVLMPMCRISIFDGDRFSTGNSLEMVSKAGCKIAGLLLMAPRAMLTERRKARGSNQNTIWMAGRETKANNFASRLKRAGADVKKLIQRDGYSSKEQAEKVSAWLAKLGAE